MSDLRFEYRKANNLISPFNTDFDYQLNSAGKIDGISARPKNAAHKLVEEAMVATNICAGELLAQHNAGLANINGGFRKERLGEVKALLKEENLLNDIDIESLSDYVDLFKKLVSEQSYIQHPLRRLNQFGHISNKPSPHMTMGLAHYATVTSPIRRFADLYNHWALKSILLNQPMKPISNQQLESVEAQLQLGKQAERELFQSLIVGYTGGLIGMEAHGKIRIVTQQGFGVRIDENGIEGFILFPKSQEKKFDAKRMTLTVGETTFALDQTVKVKVQSVDKKKKRIAFELINE